MNVRRVRRQSGIAGNDGLKNEVRLPRGITQALRIVFGDSTNPP